MSMIRNGAGRDGLMVFSVIGRSTRGDMVTHLERRLMPSPREARPVPCPTRHRAPRRRAVQLLAICIFMLLLGAGITAAIITAYISIYGA